MSLISLSKSVCTCISWCMFVIVDCMWNMWLSMLYISRVGDPLDLPADVSCDLSLDLLTDVSRDLSLDLLADDLFFDLRSDDLSFDPGVLSLDLLADVLSLDLLADGLSTDLCCALSSPPGVISLGSCTFILPRTLKSYALIFRTVFANTFF